MSGLKEGFRINETRIVSLLSSNFDHLLGKLPASVVNERTSLLLRDPSLPKSHKAQILLCLIEKDGEIGYQSLLHLFEDEAQSDPLSRKVVARVRESMLPSLGEDSSSRPYGTVFPDCKLDEKLTSIDPNLLAFILSLNMAKIKAILSTSWLEVIPILSESGLMTPSLRRRLTERNCTSFEKAEMILNHVASSPDGPVRLLYVIRRLSVSDGPSHSLVESITKTISSLSDQCVASVVEQRIKRVWFPSGSCWPKRIEASEPLDEDLYQYLYSQVWWLARSGDVSKAFTLVNSNRSLHPDIQTALAEVALTTPSKDANLYNDLENLLLKCRQDGCWNSDLLCVRIHKRLVVFYFYTHQNMAKAYHHLYKGYEICTRIEPDEGTARIIASWGEYMHMIGDYEESRKSFALAVDHAERVPTWMKPMVEGVKIDKALFHVHRGNLYKDQRGSCPESNKEFEDAIKTLESLDVSLLPTSHLSFVYYVRARIAFYYQDIPKAREHTDDAMRLEPFEHSPYYRRAASFNQVLSIL